MSKKGSFFTMVTGVQAMILLVALMIIFGIIFTFLSAKTTIYENQFVPMEDLRLINYLRTPIIINNQQTSLSDFIISANSDLEKRRILRSEIRKIISPYPKKDIGNRIRITYPDGDIWNVGEINNREILFGNLIYTDLTEDKIIKISSINFPTDNPEKSILIELFDDPNKITTVEGTGPTSLNYPEFEISGGGVPLSEFVDTAPIGEIIEDYNGDKWVKVGKRPGPYLEEDDKFWMSEGYFCNTKIIDGSVVDQKGKIVCVEYPNFPLEFDFNLHPYLMDTLEKGGLCDVGCCERSNWHIADVVASAGQISKFPFNIDPELASISYINEFYYRPIKIPSVYSCAANNVYPKLLEHIKKFGDEFNLKSPKKLSQKEFNKFMETYSKMEGGVRNLILWGGTQIITSDNKWWMYVGNGNWIESSSNLCKKFIWKKNSQNLLRDGYCDDQQYFLDDKFINSNQKTLITFEQLKEKSKNE